MRFSIWQWPRAKQASTSIDRRSLSFARFDEFVICRDEHFRNHRRKFYSHVQIHRPPLFFIFFYRERQFRIDPANFWKGRHLDARRHLASPNQSNDETYFHFFILWVSRIERGLVILCIYNEIRGVIFTMIINL